jgi:hypothetical protein
MRDTENLILEDTTCTSTYASRLNYVANCVSGTTFGPELLHAALPSYGTAFLHRWAKLQNFYFSKGPYFYMVVAIIVVNCLLKYTEVVTFEHVKYTTAVCTGLALIAFLVDVFMYLFIDIPLQLAFDCALVAKGETSGHNNMFIKITATTSNELIATNLKDHVLTAEIIQRGEVKLMIYNNTWEKKWLRGSTWPITRGPIKFHTALGTFQHTTLLVAPGLLWSLDIFMFFPLCLAFVLDPQLCLAFWQTGYDGLKVLFLSASWTAGWTLVSGPLLAIALSWAKDFVLLAINAAMCCIPRFIAARIRNRIRNRMLAKVRDTALQGHGRADRYSIV